VLSTDKVVHQLYDSPEVRDAVTERFGPGVAPQGKVDRDAVARAAFATPENRRWLEGLLWPKVGERMARWREQAQARTPPPPAIVAEVPLLFESGMDEAFDATIAVTAPEALRAERAGARGHDSVDERNTRQLTQAEKAQRATYAVSNDGPVADLEQKLSAVLDMLNR
jgi:dephospho-CoA kinase